MTLAPFTRERSDLARIRRDMDDLFGLFFEGSPGWTERERMVWPVVDITEDENAISVKAEVPGCRAEDIDISVQGNILTISGEKRHEEEKKEKGFYYAERSYSSFRRDLNLPSEVDPAKIDASYKEGVLNIRLSKSERTKPVKVKVKGQ